MICEDGQHVASPNPRRDGLCVKCARPIPETLRPRDLPGEREITGLASRAGGVPYHASLDTFAEGRAWKGGVRVDLEADREASEELGDCRNYLVWGIQDVHDRAMAGDHDALELYSRRMRALASVQRAWAELHTRSA